MTCWLDRAILRSVCAVIWCVPLYVDLLGWNSFELDKNVLGRALAAVASGGILLSMLASRRSSAPLSAEKPSLRVWLRSRAAWLIAALVVVVGVLSTATSISPDVSFWGSTIRLSGTYSLIAWLVFFIAASRIVWRDDSARRFSSVLLLASIPVSLYLISQHFGLDPVRWSGGQSERIGGTLGNPIFAGGYLVMVLPFTLAALAKTWRSARTSRSNPREGETDALYVTGRAAVLLVAYIAALALTLVIGAQNLQMWWGALPVLGLVFALAAGPLATSIESLPARAALVFFAAAALVQLVALVFTQSRGPWIGAFVAVAVLALLLAREQRRLLLGTSAALIVLGVGVLVLNLADGPRDAVRNIPYLGRLTTILETEGGTGKVRLLLWSATSRLLADHPAVGGSDPLSSLRPLVGYGPETMDLAFEAVYPADLAHYETRGATWDRAHNLILDLAVSGGALGVLAFLVAVFAALGLGLHRLRAHGAPHHPLLLPAIAALCGHLVETQLGLQVAATASLFWILLGICLSRVEAPAPEPQPEPTPRAVPPPAKRGKVRTRRAPAIPAPTPEATRRHVFDPSLLAPGVYIAITLIGLLVLTIAPPVQDAILGVTVPLLWFLCGLVVFSAPRWDLKMGPGWKTVLAGTFAAIVVGVLSTQNAALAAADIYHRFGQDALHYGDPESATLAFVEGLHVQAHADRNYGALGSALAALAKQRRADSTAHPPLGLDDIPLHVGDASRSQLLNMAETALTQAEHLSPLRSEYPANLARLHRSIGDAGDRAAFSKSRSEYARAVALSPNNVTLLDEWADVLLLDNAVDEALAKANASLQKDDQYWLTYATLARAYATKGQLDQALQSAEMAVKLAPPAEAEGAKRIQSGVLARLGRR